MSQSNWVPIGNLLDVGPPTVGPNAVSGICELMHTLVREHYKATVPRVEDLFCDIMVGDNVCEAVYRCLQTCQYRWLAPHSSNYTILANRDGTGSPESAFIESYNAGADAYDATASTIPSEYPMWYAGSDYGRMRREAWALIHMHRFHFQADLSTGDFSYDPINTYGDRGEEVE